MDYEAVLAVAKKLDIDERTLLAWELWYGIQEETANAEITDELEQELNRRLEEYRAHPERAVPWEQVRDRIRQTLNKSQVDEPHIRQLRRDRVD